MKKIPLLFLTLFLNTACTRNTVEDIENPDFLDITHETHLSLQTTEEISYEIVNHSEETFYYNHLEYYIEENVEGKWVNLDLVTIPSPDAVGPTPLRTGQPFEYTANLVRGGDHIYSAGEHRLRFKGWFDSSDKENNDYINFTIEFTLE